MFVSCCPVFSVDGIGYYVLSCGVRCCCALCVVDLCYTVWCLFCCWVRVIVLVCYWSLLCAIGGVVWLLLVVCVRLVVVVVVVPSAVVIGCPLSVVVVCGCMCSFLCWSGCHRLWFDVRCWPLLSVVCPCLFVIAVGCVWLLLCVIC